MKMYLVPPATDEEEKIIGGLLTLKQFFWVLAGGLLGGASCLFVYNNTDSLFLGIICLVFFLGIFLPFAFVRKHDMSLLKYLKVKARFKKKSKYLELKRKVSE